MEKVIPEDVRFYLRCESAGDFVAVVSETTWDIPARKKYGTTIIDRLAYV